MPPTSSRGARQDVTKTHKPGAREIMPRIVSPFGESGESGGSLLRLPRAPWNGRVDPPPDTGKKRTGTACAVPASWHGGLHQWGQSCQINYRPTSLAFFK